MGPGSFLRPESGFLLEGGGRHTAGGPPDRKVSAPPPPAGPHPSPFPPQPCASRRARTGDPAAGPSSACAALASAEPAVRRSFLRRNSTPRTQGQHRDAQPRGPPTCAGAALPEKAPQPPEHGQWHHSGLRPGESPPRWDQDPGAPSLPSGASSSGPLGEDLGGEDQNSPSSSLLSSPSLPGPQGQ